MKVVFAITGFTRCVGGAERSLAEIANAMHERGCNVVILNSEKQQCSVPFYYLEPDIPIYNTWVYRKKKSATGNHLFGRIRYRIARRLRKFIKHIVKADIFPWISWGIYYSPLIKQYKRLIHEHKPDIVVAFTPRTFTILAQALRGTGIPFIAVHRNSTFRDYVKGKYSPFSYDLHMRKRAIKLADRVVVQMDSYKEYYDQLVQRKVHVIPNIVVRQPTNNTAQRKCILSVGRYSEQKNHILLVKAFALICDKYPEWDIVIYGGEGELKNEVVEYITKSKLDRRISVRGVTKDIHEAYASSAIFAFPSLWEGFSRAHSEAMAHGLPSVVLDSCQYAREMISASSGGLIAADDPHDFAEKIEYLIQDADLRNRLGENARNYVKRFEPESIFGTWEDVIRDTISASGAL